MNSGGFAGGNFPELRKPAEVIEANVVEILRDPTHALDPPGVSAIFHDVPAIEWVAPTLAVFAEEIGWNASDDFGIEVGVQAEKIGMRPDIGAVKIHENGDIADD